MSHICVSYASVVLRNRHALAFLVSGPSSYSSPSMCFPQLHCATHLMSKIFSFLTKQKTPFISLPTFRQSFIMWYFYFMPFTIGKKDHQKQLHERSAIATIFLFPAVKSSTMRAGTGRLHSVDTLAHFSVVPPLASVSKCGTRVLSSHMFSRISTTFSTVLSALRHFQSLSTSRSRTGLTSSS